MNDPVVQEIDMEPGGVLVVGRRGRFTMHRHASGNICEQAVHCDFVGPDGLSRAHKALVNERWALHTEDGLPILSEIRRHEQELAQERDKPEKRPEVAEKAEGHSAACSEGASDLPELRSQEELDRMCPPCNGDCCQGRDCPARVERRLPLWQGWLVVAIGVLVLFAFAWPDLMAWINGDPPVLIGDQP